MPIEPDRLKEFFSGKTPFVGRLFTCARPGRSLGPKVPSFSDQVVRDWVRGLPSCRPLHIISLLGKKPDGLSEYSYYSFRGGCELETQRPGTLTFQEWLDINFTDSQFQVADFPTTDTVPIEEICLTEICTRVQLLLSLSINVVIVDSGGVGRTGKVCAKLGAKA